MAAVSRDINIAIKITSTNAELAADRLERVANALERIQTTGIGTIKTTDQLQRGTKETAEQVTITESQLRQLSEALQDAGISGQALKRILSEFPTLAPYFKGVKISIKGTTDEMEKGTGISKRWAALTEDLAANMTLISDRFAVYEQRVKASDLMIRKFTAGEKWSAGQTAILADILGMSTDATEKGLTAYRDMNRQMMVLSATTRATIAQTGAIGRGYRMVGRSVFWLGLGIMFVTMAWTRMNRMAYAVVQAQRSVERAQENLVDANKEYHQTVLLYGSASEEAVMASRRLRDAQYSLTDSQHALREAHENQVASWVMFAMGTIPTVIRAISDVSYALRFLRIARVADIIIGQKETAQTLLLKTALIAQASQMGLNTSQLKALLGVKILDTSVTTKEAVAENVLWLQRMGTGIASELESKSTLASASAKGIETASTWSLVVAKWANVKATLAQHAATIIGIGAAMAAIAAIAIMITQVNSMSDVSKESTESIDELTASLGPYSLASSMKNVIDTTKDMSSEFKRIPEVDIKQTVRRELIDIDRLGELQDNINMGVRTGLGVHNPLEVELTNLPFTPTQQFNINVYGPWYIREDADVYRIRKELEKMFMSGYLARGGK